MQMISCVSWPKHGRLKRRTTDRLHGRGEGVSGGPPNGGVLSGRDPSLLPDCVESVAGMPMQREVADARQSLELKESSPRTLRACLPGEAP